MFRYFAPLLLLLLLSSQLTAQNATSLFKEAKEYRKTGKTPKAIKLFEEALAQAEREKNTQLQMNCHLELAELKDNVINYKEALSHYQSFSKLYKKQVGEKTKKLEDSVNNLKSEVEYGMEELETKNIEIETKKNEIDSLTTAQLKSQLAILDLELANQKHQLDIEESENRKNLLLLIVVMFFIVVVFVGRAYILKRRGVVIMRNKNYQIVKEKEKSDNLLLNILPETVADELKEFGKTKPLKHEMATVMFTDFKGFTKFSETRSPEELVAVIDYYFRAFDQIITKYGIEKIKTIGDAYLCVCGVPKENPEHAANMILAAFEMLEFVNQTSVERKKNNAPHLEMRIGIHSGSLVAGVVGSRKFAYDIWGDTVNIAARMEQSGAPGHINVSESVHVLAKDKFTFEYRGEVEAKNKGKMKMYFVNEK